MHLSKPIELWDFPNSTSGKESACQFRRCKRHEFNPWVRKILWNRKWQPIPVLLPGKSHGEKSPAGQSPWGCKESNMTEHVCVCACTHAHTHTELYTVNASLYVNYVL